MKSYRTALLAKVTASKANAVSLEANIRAEYAERIRLEVAGAWQQVEDAVAAAADAGVSLRQIGIAYGSSNFGTIKTRVEAGRARARLAAPVVEPDPGVSNLRALVEVTERPDGGFDLRTLGPIPPDLWTFPPGRVNRPTEPWEGTCATVAGDARMPSTGGDTPLWAEWRAGTWNV